LEKCAATLRETEAAGKAAALPRQYRLCWEGRRGTALEADGIDPLYPTLHAKLREADQTLARRFHGALAKLTGAADEVDRLEADWPLLDQRLARLREELGVLQAKAAAP
jgi:hypothetical protein